MGILDGTNPYWRHDWERKEKPNGGYYYINKTTWETVHDSNWYAVYEADGHLLAYYNIENDTVVLNDSRENTGESKIVYPRAYPEQDKIVANTCGTIVGTGIGLVGIVICCGLMLLPGYLCARTVDTFWLNDKTEQSGENIISAEIYHQDMINQGD